MQDHAFIKNEAATNEEFNRDQAASNTKITAGVHQQILKLQIGQSSYKGKIDASNALKSRTIKSSSKKSCDRTSCATDAQAKSALLPKAKDFDGERSRMLCSFLQQQSAPDVDIQTFRGDPLECHFFMSSFKEAVECKIDDPHGRLVQLLKFTDGEAKETIRHCIQQPSEIGYRLAKLLLEDHYGNPRLRHMRHVIACTCLCTCLKHWRRAKKSTPCLIKKASNCAADHMSKTTKFLIFHFL